MWVEPCVEQGQYCSLADLYAINNMPVELLKAHCQVDKMVAFLFECYQAMTVPLLPTESNKKKKTKIN